MLHYTSNTGKSMAGHNHDELLAISARNASSATAAPDSDDNNDDAIIEDGDDSNARWEYEEITLGRGPAGFGFTIAGGIDNPHYKNDNSIYITRFLPNGPAALDGRLKLEDIIVKVDSFDLTEVNHSEAVAALKNSGNRVQLLIRRRKQAHSNNNSINQHTLASFKQKKQHTVTNSKSANNNNNNNNNQNRTFSLTRLFSSGKSNSASNQLPPLPRHSSNSGNSNTNLQRGSVQYSTTRDSSTSNKATAPKLRAASSSLSLQNSNDELDNGRGVSNLILNRENINPNITHSRSTSAIDSEAHKNVSRLPRTVTLQRSNKGLGFNIFGYVAGGGTFISYIVPGGPAERSKKLYCGDQILSANGVDLRFATHEEAATALKRGQTVKLVVKYRPQEYIKYENKINDLRERRMLSVGTLRTSLKRSLYARALFDYDPSKDSGLPSKGLPFKFGDILHIINASDDDWWQARKVLENGQEDIVYGIIPSKKRVEKRERARLKTVKFINRNSSESALSRRKKRLTFSKKFPFMKSRENVDGEFGEYDLTGSQSNSRGILISSSATSINNNTSERGSIKNDAEETILSYEPVLQQDINYARPVALYGPSPIKDEVEALRDDLSCDDRFFKMESIVPYTTRPPKEGEVDGVKYHFVSLMDMRRDLARSKFVEAGEWNGNLYGTSIDSIREIAESGRHCLLNISPKDLKKLHDAGIYPITLFIKPKSIESLLEMNKRWSEEDAANVMEHANRFEQDHGAYFTATIQMDTSNEVLREIIQIISQQSGPRIWIPTTFEALNVE